MPLLPGTPIPTQHVSPLVQIMQQGDQAFARGAQLASARITQNQQGLSAFLQSSLRERLAREQKAFQEKQLEINTGLAREKMNFAEEQASLDRNFRAKQAAIAQSAARAREDRMAGESAKRMALAEREFGLKEQEMKLKERKFETEAELAERELKFTEDLMSEIGSGFQPDVPATEQFGPMPSFLPVSQPSRAADFSEPSNTLAPIITPEESDELKFKTEASYFPERQALQNQGIGFDDARWQAQINMLKEQGMRWLATGNTSGAVAALNEVKRLTFERDWGSNEAIGNMQTVARMSQVYNGFDPLAYVPNEYKPSYYSDETGIHGPPKPLPTPLALVESPIGEWQKALAPGATSQTTLRDTSSVLETKLKSLQMQRTAMRLNFTGQDQSHIRSLMSEPVDLEIKNVTDRMAGIEKQIAANDTRKLAGQISPADTLTIALDTQSKLATLDADSAELGSRPDPDYPQHPDGTGKIGKVTKSYNYWNKRATDALNGKEFSKALAAEKEEYNFFKKRANEIMKELRSLNAEKSGIVARRSVLVSKLDQIITDNPDMFPVVAPPPETPRTRHDKGKKDPLLNLDTGGDLTLKEKLDALKKKNAPSQDVTKPFDASAESEQVDSDSPFGDFKTPFK